MKKSSNARAVLWLCVAAGALIGTPVVVVAQQTDATPAATATLSPVTTDSGLQYRNLAIGKGEAAQAGDTVDVHYTGWLQNADGSRGRKFDSSYDRGEPLTFTIGMRQVIKGWDEGVQGMQAGGRRRLIIPSALAYGTRGTGNGLIPPNANLIFEVALIRIK
jgi:FKBP-type peptidyl-prolyl cis-trans isomerase FkpA